jgi:starch synthase (maltosyl-transferring)
MLEQRAADGKQRVVIEHVLPEIDCGRFGVKRVVGDTVVVEADVFADGHDQVACQILYWQDKKKVQALGMKALGNDRWRAEFAVENLGRYQYTVEGWIDRFQTWHLELAKRIAAGQDVSVELVIGAGLIDEAAAGAARDDAAYLREWSKRLRAAQGEPDGASIAFEEKSLGIIQRNPVHHSGARYEKELSVTVDREKARFSTWYEIFPRSCAAEAGRHGTFRDCERWLPYVAEMGFDVIYLPPVHPIGRSFRKGKNNSVEPLPGDVGSPWAIGSAEGGHTSVHPELGTLEDFKRFVAAAEKNGLEVALDIAFQCSPDHPWVQQKPEWFRKRPDGTIQYAENPPKKYQDIYPLDFESADSRAFWEVLKGVFEFWIAQGVRIFRVDNPHTKPFSFWEWAIGAIKERHPDVILLAEAFTRPHVMNRLAKLGFSQSYTYFTWRNTKEELAEYFTELTQTEAREYFRPNLWPNTPDILPEFLQLGGRAAFMVRLILAATLGASYGIYGPAFELCENAPMEPGSEEYLNSEKYELKNRDLDSASSLKDLIARINSIRKKSPALQKNRNLQFHDCDNASIFCYSKASDDRSEVILVIVNLDSFQKQAGWVQLDLESIGLDAGHAFRVFDLLAEEEYLWQGARNYVELTPEIRPAHILRVQRRN